MTRGRWHQHGAAGLMPHPCKRRLQSQSPLSVLRVKCRTSPPPWGPPLLREVSLRHVTDEKAESTTDRPDQCNPYLYNRCIWAQWAVRPCGPRSPTQYFCSIAALRWKRSTACDAQACKDCIDIQCIRAKFRWRDTSRCAEELMDWYSRKQLLLTCSSPGYLRPL